MTVSSANEKRDIFWPGGKPIKSQLAAIIEHERDGYVAKCSELDVVSQGNTVVVARDNLAEVLALFFETAPAGEIKKRLRGENPRRHRCSHGLALY